MSYKSMQVNKVKEHFNTFKHNDLVRNFQAFISLFSLIR
jgi:hypothetical protein